MSIDNKKLKVCPRITDTSVTDKGEICIQWTQVPDAEKYAVSRSEKVDGDYERLAWAKKTEYTDKTAKENVTYWYRIIAVKPLENKKTSKKKSPVAAQVVSSISAPVNLKAEAANGKIRLKWKAPADVTAFTVYRRNDNFDQLLPVSRVEKASFTDKSIAQGQIYHYSVQSLCGEKQGNFSSEVSCVSLDPGEIINYKARLFKKIDLQARIVAGADGYIFERSEDGESFEEIAKTESDVSFRFTDTVKKAFSVYYYRVRAYKNVCGSIYISAPSEAVRVKSK